MKKVLLTGATGLIGKYAIKPLLEAGFEVFAVSSAEKNNEPGINWIKSDLLDFSSIRTLFEIVKPEYLLHFAWDTTPGSYLESNLNFDWVQSSLEMLKQFKINGGKRAVFAGTCFEYDFQDFPLEEYGKLNPTSTYAKCKNNLNQLAALYCEKNEMSFGWGRIFYVYGENEHEKRLVPHVIKSLSNNQQVNIFTGDLERDYMFAGDIAKGFVYFLDSQVKGCVNICTGKAVKIKDIALYIAGKLGKENFVNIENKSTNDPKIIVGDTKRLFEEIKFKPEYSLEQGLDKVITTFINK